MTNKTDIEKQLKESNQNMLAKAIEEADACDLFLNENEALIRAIEKAIEPVAQWYIHTDIDIRNNCIDLKFAGDKHTLDGIFRALRRIGYKPDRRPKSDKIDYFTSFFRHDNHDMKVWLNFVSTVCKKVKVGTEMVEQDVYEIVCE